MMLMLADDALTQYSQRAASF